MLNLDLINRVTGFVSQHTHIDPEVIRETMTLVQYTQILDLIIDDYVDRLGLSRRQIDILEILFYEPDHCMIPAEIAEKVHLSRPSMTSQIDSLEKQGYTVRCSHPDDRRKINVLLTQKGLDFCEKMLPVRYRDMNDVFGKLTSEERKKYLELYEKIINICLENETIGENSK